eukprot:m.389854 g.389854  ORF g.389854 m.389854 type:complete len:55 (-) comp185090_c0_seq1:108-272(-)
MKPLSKARHEPTQQLNATLIQLLCVPDACITAKRVTGLTTPKEQRQKVGHFVRV